MSQAAYTPPPVVDRIQSRALIVGGIGVIACVIGAFFKPAQFFNSWLISFMFVAGITLGCLALVMLQYLTGGAWGIVIRRVLESATRTLPLVVLLFIPLLFGLQSLYGWARPAEVAAHEALQHKRLYLNVTFFLIRAVIYFAAWLVLAYFLNKWSRQQDQAADRRLERRFQLLSGGGLVLYGFTVTFAVIDWVMSLEPQWFSTIFGLLFVAGQGLSALAFVIAALVVLSRYEPLAHVISRGHLQDLGKLMLTFVMLWAYMSFSQFLIIWSGNLPEEAFWYVKRLHSGWQWIGLLLVLFHFALPFLLLLSRDLKRSGRRLVWVALGVMVMRVVDLFWIIAPTLHEQHLTLHWMDLAALIGLSGIWLAFFAWQLRRRPLLPVNDPHFGEVLQHEHH